MARYQVYRQFRSNRPHAVGDVVELQGPNLRLLEDLGYIEKVGTDVPLTESASASGTAKSTPTATVGSKAKAAASSGS
jgi:hypothetical protein